jgi:mannosyltransferase
VTTTLDRSVRTASVPTRRLPRAAAPVLVGLLGLAIGLAGAGIPSIWYDEAATVSSSLRTWPQLLAEIGTVDLVHAAYYAGMHVWFDLVGYTPVTLRLPSAVAIGAAAALVVVLGRLFARPRLGLIAGLVFVLLPRTTWAGTEGRSYALTALLAIAVTVVLVVAMRDGRRRWWLGYAALAALSCVVFIYLALVLVAHAVTIALAARSRSTRASAKRWMLAATAAALAVLPFLVVTTTQRGQVDWLPTLNARTVERVFVEQWFFTSEAFAVAGWAGILLGSVLLVRRARPGLSLAALLIPAAVVPTVLLLLVTASGTPLYFARYLTMCLPFVALLIGAAIDALPRRPLVVIALAALVALAVPQIVEQRAPRAKEHTDWSAVAALIAAERAEDGADSTTAIVFDSVQRHPRATSRVIAYSYPDAFAGAIDVTLDVSAADSGRLWETTIPLSAGLGRLQDADAVYLLTSPGDDGTYATAATLAPLGWRITDRWMISEVEIIRFER